MARSFARSKREERPPGEDIFVEKLLQATAWAQENARTVILATVILGLGIAAVVYYRSYRATVREQAAVELQNLAAEFDGTDPALAADRLQDFVARYERTEAAAEGRLLLARLQLAEHQPERALETLAPVLSATAPDIPIGFAARRLRAAAHEAQGQPQLALDIYAELAHAARFPFQRRAALAHQARLLIDTQRLPEAAFIYEELVRQAEAADLPPEAGLYRLRLGEIRGAVAGEPREGAADGT